MNFVVSLNQMRDGGLGSLPDNKSTLEDDKGDVH